MPSALYELNNFCFQGPAKVFFDVAREEWSIPPVSVSYTGNDPRGVLGKRDLRPATGIFGGSFANFVESFDQSLEKVQQANSKVIPLDFRVQEEVTKCEGISNYTDDPLIAKYFRLNGSDGGYYYTGGGSSTIAKVSMLVHRQNRLKKIPKYSEFRYYPRGVILASPVESSAKKVTTYKFTFLPVAALGPDNCPLPFGQQTYLGWFVRVKNDGTNELVHPRYPNSTSWRDPEYLPFYEMGLSLRLKL